MLSGTSEVFFERNV